MRSNILLSIEDLCFSYEKNKVLKNINFDLYNNEILGIVGESGAGKSTLALILSSFLSIDSGKIYYKDEDISSIKKNKRKEIRKKIQLIFQDSKTSTNPNMLVFDYLKEPLKNYYNNNFYDSLDIIERYLSEVNIPNEYLYKKLKELSGGERQRIAILKSISIKPGILICDEPTSALDVFTQGKIIDLLRSIKEKFNMSLIFISHNLPLVSNICDRIIIMKDGKILDTVTPDNLLETKNTYIKNLIKATFEI